MDGGNGLSPVCKGTLLSPGHAGFWQKISEDSGGILLPQELRSVSSVLYVLSPWVAKLDYIPVCMLLNPFPVFENNMLNEQFEVTTSVTWTYTHICFGPSFSSYFCSAVYAGVDTYGGGQKGQCVFIFSALAALSHCSPQFWSSLLWSQLSSGAGDADLLGTWKWEGKVCPLAQPCHRTS